MKNVIRVFIVVLLFFAAVSTSVAAGNDKEVLFQSKETREEFARDVSLAVYDGWKKWQDGVIINDVHVEGSKGLLLPGDMSGKPLTVPLMMGSFDKKGKTQDHIVFVKAVTEAVSNGVSKWQRGYRNEDLSFPQGANTVITLSPTQNLPITLDSGTSSGDKAMTEKALYNYMLYRSPIRSGEAKIVLKAVSRALADAFSEWKRTCSIVGIVASGGIGPQPAPMGPGPGPVRGAEGKNGKLIGAYINKDLMYNRMIEYFEK